MKTRFTLIQTAALLVMLSTINHAPPAFAQGTAFTYQGRLNDGTNPANGSYDLQFRVFDAAPLNTGNSLGSPNPNSTNAVPVSNGLFTVTLDFGNNPFATGAPRWLEIAVRTNGNGSFATLNPRQALTATPYAITASNLTGTLPDTRLSANVAFLDHTQTFTGNNSFGNVSVNAPSALSFGATTRQMINLWNTAYGIGVQPSTHYFRADAGASFAWYEAGGHINSSQDPGPGGTRLMTLSSSGGLYRETSSGLFSGVTVDDKCGCIRAGSDLANSYFFQARTRNFFSADMLPVFLVRGDRRVGVGTSSPQSRFHSVAEPDAGNAIQGSCSDATGSGVYGEHTAQGWGVAGRSSGTGVGVYGDNPNPTGWAGYFNGQVHATGSMGWGTSTLSLDQNGAIELGDSTAASGVPYIDFHLAVGHSQDFNVRLMNDADGQLSLFGNLNVTANASVCSLTIRGGCDLAEPFEMSDREIPKGSLVIIDDEHSGKLKMAGQEYDTRVAGIISGANGINPGISLQQEGIMDSGQNVALSGRVYALADASYGAIKPGDLLTSSATPGHVMKVRDHARASGAIVGKAMGGLSEGKGMVLVLVTLQ